MAKEGGRDGDGAARATRGELLRASLERLGGHLRSLMPASAPPETRPGDDATARALLALATLVGLGDFARAAAMVEDDERHGLRPSFAFLDRGGAEVEGDAAPVALALTVTCVRVDGAGGGAPAALRVEMDANGVLTVSTREAGPPGHSGLPDPAYAEHPFPDAGDAVEALPGLLVGISLGEAYEHLLRPARDPMGATPVGAGGHWVVTRAQARAEAALDGTGGDQAASAALATPRRAASRSAASMTVDIRSRARLTHAM